MITSISHTHTLPPSIHYLEPTKAGFHFTPKDNILSKKKISSFILKKQQSQSALITETEEPRVINTLQEKARWHLT